MIDDRKIMKPIVPPKKEDFNGTQLSVFQSFLYNTPTEKERLSNTFDLWDSVPRYSISRKEMDKMRKSNTFPLLIDIPFHYRGNQFKAVIQPAWIKDDNDKILGYYPSANEELIEDSLRKIAEKLNHGYHKKNNHKSGVTFSLSMLREELIKRGHGRTYKEIILSLKILSGSIIEIQSSNKQDGSEGFIKNGYFSGLIAVSKRKLMEDSSAKWFVEFHPLITEAIESEAYRQYNYAQMMNQSTQLARWLHKLLSNKFTFASIANTFELRYSTVKRDSALLNNYSRERKAIEVLIYALNELKTNNVLQYIEQKYIYGIRNKIEDIIFILSPTIQFISEMKAANKRKSLSKIKNVDNSTTT